MGNMANSTKETLTVKEHNEPRTFRSKYSWLLCPNLYMKTYKLINKVMYNYFE